MAEQDGKEKPREIVVRSTAIIVLNDRQSETAYMPIVQRSEASSFGGLWELPGGKQDELGSPETAIQEVFEETGLRLSLGRLETLSLRQGAGHVIERNDENSKRLLQFVPYFYEQTVDSLPQIQLSHEHGDALWFVLPGLHYETSFVGAAMPVLIEHRKNGIAVASLVDTSYKSHVKLPFTDISAQFVRRYLWLDSEADYMPEHRYVRPGLYERNIIPDKRYH